MSATSRTTRTKITRFQDFQPAGLSMTARLGAENDPLTPQKANISSIDTNELLASVKTRTYLRSQSSKRLHDSASTGLDNQIADNTQRTEQPSATEFNAKNILASPGNETTRSGIQTSRPSSASARKLIKKQLKVDINVKSELMAVATDKTIDHKPTYLSHDSERRMLRQLYVNKPDDKTSFKFMIHHDSTEPHFQNMTNEELEMQQSMYEKFKKKFNRMVFDNNRNYLYFKVPKLDKTLSPDAPKNQTTNNLLRKIEAKVKAVNPDSVLQNAKLEKPGYMKTARDIHNYCRDQKLDLLGTKLRGLRNDAVIEKAKTEILDISNKAGLTIDKLEDQNLKVREENVCLVTKNEDLVMENDILKRKTQLLQQEILHLTTENESLSHRIQNLEYFAPAYFALQAKYKDISVTNIIAKIERLENNCQEYLKRISELEEELRNRRGMKREVEAIVEEKDNQLKSEQIERNKLIQMFKGEISELESEIRSREDHQQGFIKLSNRVMGLYMKWVEQCDVYTKVDEKLVLDANPKDSFEIVDILERIVRIATPETMQKYMRKVIVSANQLRRKYLPKEVNLKFDPDKIYEAISKYIHTLETEIKRLKGSGPHDLKKSAS